MVCLFWGGLSVPSPVCFMGFVSVLLPVCFLVFYCSFHRNTLWVTLFPLDCLIGFCTAHLMGFYSTAISFLVCFVPYFSPSQNALWITELYGLYALRVSVPPAFYFIDLCSFFELLLGATVLTPVYFMVSVSTVGFLNCLFIPLKLHGVLFFPPI